MAETVRLLGEKVTEMGWRKRLRGRTITRKDYEAARAIAALPKLKHVPGGEARGQIALFADAP